MKKNFTLIELLVVTAIIAILASMLLPALNQARERGRTVKCLNKLKYIGTGFIMYSSDNQDYYANLGAQDVYPQWYIGNLVAWWHVQIAPYLGMNRDGDFRKQLRDSRKYECEKRTRIAGFDWPRTDSVTNYGTNGWVNKGYPVKITKLEKPTRVCLLSEVKGQGVGGNGPWFSGTLSGNMADVPSHNGNSANVLFFAGNASTLLYRTIPCPQGTGVKANHDPKQAGSYRFWSSGWKWASESFIE